MDKFMMEKISVISKRVRTSLMCLVCTLSNSRQGTHPLDMMNSISLEMDSALRGGSDDGAGDEAGRVDEHDVAGVESGGGGRRWREEVKKGRGEQGDKRWRVWWRWEKVAPGKRFLAFLILIKA
uniref:Uncharacterized protein n=1 Tax=Oryza meridionalis TaxID=40149 RepID=A0A0E0CFR5_9ORYZ